MELSETKRRIIKAAELEFAKEGYSGASIRSITSNAGVNIAAINYHFGTKEDLFKQMARSRFEPINELRFRLLDELEAKHHPDPPPIDGVIEIIIHPLVTNFLAAGSEGSAFMRAMGKALSEERPFMQELQKDLLKDIIARVAGLFMRSYPTAQKEQFAYCMHFMSCSIVGAMIQNSRLETVYGQAPGPDTAKKLSENLKNFISGGLKSVLESKDKP